jgi:hypothetical protein
VILDGKDEDVCVIEKNDKSENEGRSTVNVIGATGSRKSNRNDDKLDFELDSSSGGYLSESQKIEERLEDGMTIEYTDRFAQWLRRAKVSMVQLDKNLAVTTTT